MKYITFQIKTAFKNFGRSRVRTFLTSLGILIGVLSVVILIALGVGLKSYIQGQFESLGSNLLFVLPGKIIGDDGQFQGGGDGPVAPVSFNEQTVALLKRGLSIDYIVPLYSKTVTIEATGETESGSVFASTADLFTILNLQIEYGNLFTSGDVNKRAKSVVIGSKVATKFFGTGGNAVSKSIGFSNQRYKVVGVLKEKGGGGFGGPSFDDGVYIPYTTSFIGINPDKNFATIYLGVANDGDVDLVKKQAEEILLKKFKKDDFSVVKQTEFLNAITSIFGIINSVLIAIGSISLVVGGIGIMNIMYANVTERTKEVGIRRAVGATKRDILFQFLTESVLLSLIGGIGGLLLAVLIVTIVSQFFPLAINVTSVVVALGISSAIGVFFGVFPARRAANLAPIEAIRYE